MPRDGVLYVTPVMPRETGNGLAMRAAGILEALAHRFDVHLFVVPVAGDLGPPSDFVRGSTARIGGLNLAAKLDPLFSLISRILDPEARARAELTYPKPFLSRFCTGESARCLFDWSNDAPISAVHVMRLYLAPLAHSFLRRPRAEKPFCVLDLDDDEIRTCRRMARLHRDWGDSRKAAAATAEAEKYRALAKRYLAAFDRVLLCSETDALNLADCFPSARFAVVPNGYRAVDPGRRHRPSGQGPLRMLFVGTFGYFPNADAVRFLCHEVLPALRRLTDREVRIDIAGAGGPTTVADLARQAGARLYGFVEDLAPLYAAADIAVVPLRAGGGTRIKVLEAFAHGVPVVTTRVGAEGIDAADGEHLLVAEDGEAFARACLFIKDRPELAASFATRAAALLSTRYGPTQVDAAIAATYGRAEVPPVERPICEAHPVPAREEGSDDARH
jgi:glycosyltransferase involved in cell wall biosynthesis